MASAASLPIAFDRLFKEGFVQVADPGNAGTIYVQNKGFAICEVETAGAESRVLPAAGLMGVGATLMVVGKVLAGAATITGADVSPILHTAGDVVTFVVSVNDADDTKVWRVLSQSADSSLVATNVVTRATAAAGAGLIPVSNGADKALVAATPVALGSHAINTGDATSDTMIKAVINQLVALGLFTGTAS